MVLPPPPVVSTCGFSSYDDSAADFVHWPARDFVMLVGMCGAVSSLCPCRARRHLLKLPLFSVAIS